MTRTILATATALVAAATLFTSSAEACISCEYVPEVLHHSSTSYEAPHYAKVRVYTADTERSSRPAKKRIVESEPVVKKAQTAKADPIETEAKTENSSISGAAEVAATETKVEPKIQSESSSISLASNDAAEKAPVAKPAKEAAAKPTDCKKFFASVGMTLTVPCE